MREDAKIKAEDAPKKDTKGKKANNEPISNPKDKWIPLHERESISVLRIFGICANQISMSFIWVPLSVLTNPMCKKLGLSHFTTSLVTLIGPFLGFILPPIVSSLSDSTTLKLGRRRIYMIIGELFVIVGLLMIGFCREMSKYINFPFAVFWKDEILNPQTEATFYFILGEILALTGANFANCTGRTMCMENVPSSQKVLASSICALDNAIAALISNSMGAFKLYKYTKMSNETFVLFVSCVVGVIAMSISVISTPEEQLKTKPKTINPVRNLVDAFHSLDRNMIFVLLSNFFYGFGFSQFFGQGANYIASKVFGGVPNAPDGIYDSGISYYQYLMLYLTASQLFFSSVNTKIIKKIGFKWAWSIAMICQATADVSMFLIKKKEYLFILYILCGFTSVMNNSVPNSYVGLNAPPGKTAIYVTLLILTYNVSSMCANLFLHMYLGSLPFFAENQGRLIAFGSVFCIISLLCSRIAYGDKINTKKEKDQ